MPTARAMNPFIVHTKLPHAHTHKRTNALMLSLVKFTLTKISIYGNKKIPNNLLIKYAFAGVLLPACVSPQNAHALALHGKWLFSTS